MARFYVYALLEPGTDQIRYIGKTSSPAKRLASHLSRSSAPNVRAWIASVGRPELRILAEFENETEALLAEQELIGKRRATCELLNLAVRDNRGPAQSSLFSGFGGRCVARRKELGLSQGALARQAGVTSCSLSRAESGMSQSFSAESAVLVARVLRCTVEWLVTGEECPAEAAE